MDSEEFLFRFDAGVSMPSSSIAIDNKEDVALSLAKHYLIYTCKAELDQLKEGLSRMGVIDLVNRYPLLMKPLFLSSGKPKLTPTALLNLFQVCWSPTGSMRRELEETIIYAWTQYVYSCEGEYNTSVFHTKTIYNTLSCR